MDNDVPRWKRMTFGVLALLLGPAFVMVGCFGAFTAMSLKRSPPAPELHVLSPGVVFGIGAAHAGLGAAAMGAGVGLLLGRPVAVRVWKSTSVGMALAGLGHLFSLEVQGTWDVVVAGSLLGLVVVSYALLRGRRRVQHDRE